MRHRPDIPKSVDRRPARALPWLLAFAVATSTTERSAQAQPPPTEAGGSAAEASAHFERGLTYYSEGDYDGALAEFKRAYAILPNARVLFNVGQAAFELHRYVEAEAALSAFLRDAGSDARPKQRETAQAELADLRLRIGRVVVVSNVAGAAVAVDGETQGVTPLARPLALNVGVREIVVRAPGRLPLKQEVAVIGGETTTVRMDFASSADLAITRPLPRDPDRTAAPAPTRWPAAVALGIGAAGAVTGAVFGVLALHDRTALQGACTPSHVCTPGSAGHIDVLTEHALIADAGFGVAVVGAAVGAILWATLGRAPRRSPSASASFGLGTVGGTF